MDERWGVARRLMTRGNERNLEGSTKEDEGSKIRGKIRGKVREMDQKSRQKAGRKKMHGI